MNKLTNKEVLIGFINTLTDKQARQAYLLLCDSFGLRGTDYITFNSEGNIDDTGYIKLRRVDYRRIIERFGGEYFIQACKMLSDYIQYLKDNKETRKLNRIYATTHYYIMTRGWIANKLGKQDDKLEKTTSLNKAREFILSTDVDTRYDNPEVIYLLTKYPELIINKQL